MLDSRDKTVRKDAFFIRTTEVGNYLNCPRNWVFMSHNGFNLEPTVRPQKLRFGIVWHAGMEAVYDDRDPFEALTAEFEKEIELIHGVSAYDPYIHEEIENEKLLANTLMQGYMEWRNTEATPPDHLFQPISTEKRIIVRIGNTHGYLAVRLDGEMLDEQGGLWILEHKSRGKSSSVGNPPELQLDIQMGLQMYACQRTSPHPVRGVLYNLTRKQMPSNRVKAPIYGRHQVHRSKDELCVIEDTLRNVYYEMRKDSALAKKDPEKALYTLRYNPQPMGFCSWGCSAKEICESINRREDVGYLIETSLKPRDKTIWETLEEELAEN